MSCNTIAEQIHPYMDGELPEPARAEVQRHLAACAACREALAAFQGLGRLLRRELTDAAGARPSLWPAIEARLDAEPMSGRVPAFPGGPSRRRGRLSWRTFVPVAAAAAAIVVAVRLQFRGEPVTPPEQLAQVASVEGGDRSSVVLLAGTPSDPPIILVTESPAPSRLPEGGSPL